MIQDARLPEPEVNPVISDSSRRRIGRADLVFRPFRVIVEYDGDQHRTNKAQYRKDVFRWQRFARNSWDVLRFHDVDLFARPHETLAQITEALTLGGYRAPANLAQTHTVTPAKSYGRCNVLFDWSVVMVKLFPAGTRQLFVDVVCSGRGVHEAAVALGASGPSGSNWWRESGGMTLNSRTAGTGLVDPAAADAMQGSRYLTLSDRIIIQVGVRNGWSHARIGAEIDRDRTVVWREIARNHAPDGVYYATRAHHHAHQVRRRPKTPKIMTRPELAWFITDAIDAGWSPKLISAVLTGWFPDDGSMQISHETIYRALYVQTRGVLRADLARQLSTGRTKRVPHGGRRNPSPYKDAFRISERPAEADDRAVPGHWEGDLIIGSDGTAIRTLVERSTRYVLLLHLPGDHTADTVATSMIAAMHDLPTSLLRSITWDRGTELADYRRITSELNTPVFFCDPHSPWQRGSNENTNRLLRHWFEKGSNLAVHEPAELARVQSALNHRPRPTLNMRTPTQALADLIQAA